MSGPAPVAALAWVLAGVFSLLSAAFGTSALRGDQEGLRPVLAILAGGSLLLATYLILSAIAAALPRGTGKSRPATRNALGAVALVGFAVTTFVFVAAAPGGLPFEDSWAEAIAASLGLWLGLTAAAGLGARLCWRIAGAACVALLLASVGVTIWDGQ